MQVMETVNFKQDFGIIWAANLTCPYCKKKITIRQNTDAFEEANIVTCPKCNKELELGKEKKEKILWENNVYPV